MKYTIGFLLALTAMVAITLVLWRMENIANANFFTMLTLPFWLSFALLNLQSNMQARKRFSLALLGPLSVAIVGTGEKFGQAANCFKVWAETGDLMKNSFPSDYNWLYSDYHFSVLMLLWFGLLFGAVAHSLSIKPLTGGNNAG